MNGPAGSGVRVWTVELAPALATPERLSVLSEAERQRLARYRLPRPAHEFGLTRAALRQILSRWLDVPAARVPLDSRCPRCGLPHGRPEVAGLAVTVSHTRGKALVAVAPGRVALGVDIEVVDDHAGSRTVRAGMLRERRIWVRKEAYVKACGAMPTVRQVQLSSPGRATAPGYPTLRTADLDIPGERGRRWVAALVTDRDITPSVLPWHWPGSGSG